MRLCVPLPNMESSSPGSSPTRVAIESGFGESDDSIELDSTPLSGAGACSRSSSSCFLEIKNRETQNP